MVLSYLVLGGAAFLLALAAFGIAIFLGVTAVTAHLIAGTLGSLLVAGAVFFLPLKNANSIPITFSNLLKCCAAWIISVSIQGGVFQALREQAGAGSGHEILAFAPAAVCGVVALILIAGSWIISCRVTDQRLPDCQTSMFIFIGAAIIIRLVYLGLPELMEQEAYYWNYAQHPALSYLDHPPLVAVLIRAGTALFGTTEFGVRIGAFICWFVSAFFTYRLTFRIYGLSAARAAVLLLAVLPLYFGVGFLMTPDAPLHAAWSALLYFLYRTLIEGEKKAWLGVGLSLGLGLLSKYTIVLLGPAILLFMLLDRQARSWLLKLHPYGAVLIALIVFTPVIVWNMQHDWVSFLFQSKARLTRESVFTTPHLLGYVVLILTPAGVLGLIQYLFGFKNDQHSPGEKKRIYPARAIGRAHLLCLLLTLVPFLVFFGISFTREVKLNWTSPVWLAILPFLGFTVTSAGGWFFSMSYPLIFKLWRVTVPILVCAFGLGLHYVSLGLSGLPNPPGPFLIGWDGVAQRVESMVRKVEKDTGYRPLVVGMDHYQLSSGLAFYRTKNRGAGLPDHDRRGLDETLGWHIFGHNSRMYRYWHEDQPEPGTDIIAVAAKHSRLEESFFPPEITFKTAIEPLDALKDGQPVRRFYYRVVSFPASD